MNLSVNDFRTAKREGLKTQPDKVLRVRVSVAFRFYEVGRASILKDGKRICTVLVAQSTLVYVEHDAHEFSVGMKVTSSHDLNREHFISDMWSTPNFNFISVNIQIIMRSNRKEKNYNLQKIVKVWKLLSRMMCLTKFIDFKLFLSSYSLSLYLHAIFVSVYFILNLIEFILFNQLHVIHKYKFQIKVI